MLTGIELLFFYAANVVVWLGIALLYVYYFRESTGKALENAGETPNSE